MMYTYLPPNPEWSLAGYRITLVVTILPAGAHPGVTQAYTNLLGRGGGKEVVLLRREIV